MKIIVLDGYTLNPGDLSWDELRKMGELTVYDRTPADLLLERSQGAEIIFTNKTPLGEEQFSKLPELKYVGVLATGYNVVDVESAKKRNIVVTNIPAYGTNSVAQMAFALLLELCHHVQNHSNEVKEGKWSHGLDFCFWDYPLIELAGKTIGIIGFGRIGQQVARIASAFDMRILAFSRHRDSQFYMNNFRWAEMPELLNESDIISLHCPLTKETQGLINKSTILQMKKSALLINTSRGQLIVDEDLAEALNKGIIAGAALDVLSKEPPDEKNPLLSAQNCITTPHIAWATREARSRLMDIAVQNLNSYLAGGTPMNVVNL
jgi:Lactate dehydrogenase and related dehydrogenases